MAKIKYAVVGIDPQSLNNLVGTLARGEVEGETDRIVLPDVVPTVYSIDDTKLKANSMPAFVTVNEVPFGQFLGEAVSKERRKIIQASVAGVDDKLVKDMIGKLVGE